MAPSPRRRSRISASDLAGYGSVANGTVDVDRAALDGSRCERHGGFSTRNLEPVKL